MQTHELYNGAHMLAMIRAGVVYQNIVKEDEYKSTEKSIENLIHKSLERRRSVTQPKRQDYELEKALPHAHELNDSRNEGPIL